MSEKEITVPPPAHKGLLSVRTGHPGWKAVLPFRVDSCRSGEFKGYTL